MTLRVHSPFSGELVCELPIDRGERLEHKVAAAVEAARTWREVTLGERVQRVLRGCAWFRDHAERVAREITLQMGKPLRESRAEVQGMLARAEHMASIAERALAPEPLPAAGGTTLRIEHVPLGVVLNIAAWNYPLLIAVNVVVPALLAGNAVLLKHSAKTPLCGRQFAAAFADLGPPGLVEDLVLTHEQTARLIEDPRIAHVAFTGSVEGGRAVHRAAAGRFIDVGLELGGKDPAYVAADADLELAVAGIVEGACYNAGQSCCAVERVYVHRSLHDEFVARALAALAAYRTGDPLDEATTLGPLASRTALDVLETQVEDARTRGAAVLCGGRRLDAGSGFFLPSLLDRCPQDSLAMRDESFGPLLPLRAVAGDDEALAAMNDTRYGLTASVWTADAGRAERLARVLDAGTIYQNRCDVLDPALPWTGIRDSGKGVTLSHYGLLQLTQRKGLHFRHAP